MSREPINVDSSKNAVLNKGEKEPGLPVNIPLGIVRWVAYTICFSFLLIPFVTNRWQIICGGLILGWFAGLLNVIANKKQ